MKRKNFVIVLTFKDGSQEDVRVFARDNAIAYQIARGWIGSVAEGDMVDVFLASDGSRRHLMTYYCE